MTPEWDQTKSKQNKMKRKILLYIFLFINSINIFAQQSAIVIYKAKLNSSPEIYKSIKEKFGESMMLMAQRKDAKFNVIVKDFDFTLKFNPNESRYQWQEEMPDETVNQMDYMMAKLIGDGNAIHYCNIIENLYMQQFKDVSTGNVVRETAKLKDNKWQITKETDTILGYPVIKAVQRKKVAWFTPNIPVPFGPGEARGLPGLVLKYVFANKKIIYATKIKWLKKNIKIKRPEKGILRTQEEGRAKRIKEMGKYFGN